MWIKTICSNPIWLHFSDPSNDVGDLGELADLGADLADTITSITSESSGVVSGLTSSVTSDRDIEEAEVMSERSQEIGATEFGHKNSVSSGHRLKSAMVRNKVKVVFSLFFFGSPKPFTQYCFLIRTNTRYCLIHNVLCGDVECFM